MLDGYVGCNFQFHMAALKNDTATYVLMVYPTGNAMRDAQSEQTPTLRLGDMHVSSCVGEKCC